jgi:hypothetical protein
MNGSHHPLDPRVIQALGQRVAADLTPRLVEPVAERLAELLVEAPATAKSVDAATVARMFGFSRDWVYNHAEELGVERPVDGSRPRLRFNLDIVRERVAGRGRAPERELE